MVPAFPFPGTRTRPPLATPAGMRTSMVSVRRTRPSPPQVRQGVRNLPVPPQRVRSEEHTSELQSRLHLVCRLLLEKNKIIAYNVHAVNIQMACLIMEGAEVTENIIHGVERPV